jgi:microcystin-dependent protein
MATENFSISSNISTEGIEIDTSAAFVAGDQYLTGGLVYSSGKFVTSIDNIPVGVIRMWASGTASATPPQDYLICAGQSVNVSDYPKLHSVIGYRFGGSGLSFSLPKFNLTTGDTYRAPSGVDQAALESNQLNNVNSISIGDNDSISHTHQVSTFTYTSTTGNSANTSHSHVNSSGDDVAHSHTFANTDITTNASHSHNWGNANANHTHSYLLSGNTTGVASGNPTTNHGHNTGNTVGNHIHGINSSSHSHTFGNQAFNAGSSHTHALTTNTSSDGTSHTHTVNATAVYFIIKYR